MSKYDLLTKYVGVFDDDNFGEWVIDKESKGTLEDPIVMPYVNYNKTVSDFIQDVHSVAESIGLVDYVSLLKKHGIEWSNQSMTNVDVDRLSSDVIFALVLAAVRAERFCDGALLTFFKGGYIQRWLHKLSQLASEQPSRILLNDLLKIDFSAAENVKVKFNQNDGNEDPMDVYLRDPEIVNSDWLFWRNKQRYFAVGQIAICLMKLSYDTWLLTTIKRVTKELDVINGVNYIGEEIPEYRQYFGRVVIKYHKTAQTQGMYFNTVAGDLEVLEILPAQYDGDEFPGYDRVRISYSQLKNIIERRRQSWISALENQKAVYLITDKSNGKLYVGSATSDNGMLLSRWSSYADNGHGHNVELKRVVAEKGIEHVKKYFQYSILENFNSRVDDKYILERESWWKETLQSREFGYNAN